MSNAVFPTLPGLAWNVTRTPVWSTVVKTSASGREFRSQMYSYPIWRYSMSFEVLRANAAFPEMQQLVAFFNSVNGSFDTFLYNDPDDNATLSQGLGTGDGTTKTFQLVRYFGGYTEPVWDVNGAPLVYVNGVLQTLTTHYTISATGLITFVTAPPVGQAVAWTGNFYWRCRFLQDSLEFNQFMRQLWELRQVQFTTVKP